MFGFRLFKKRNKKSEKGNNETKVSFQTIQKEIELVEVENKDFVLDISSITNNGNEFEFVVDLKNNTQEHIRIKIINIQLIHDGKELKGNSLIYEMNMGTNDAILKNTVIANGNLLKNILFTNLNLDNLIGDDYMMIELLINDQPYVLENSINNSSVNEIKIIKII